MCFFNKKDCKIKDIPTKYHIDDFVNFHHHDDLYFGTISNIEVDNQNNVFYDIDIAGQCPTTCKHIPEKEITGLHQTKKVTY